MFFQKTKLEDQIYFAAIKKIKPFNCDHKTNFEKNLHVNVFPYSVQTIVRVPINSQFTATKGLLGARRQCLEMAVLIFDLGSKLDQFQILRVQ